MNNYPRVGIGVLIFNAKDEILLGKRINSHGAFTWAPPGGHLEIGETFENCAIREVFEETGAEIKNIEFLAITNDIFSENKHYVSIFMRCRIADDEMINNCEPDKVLGWLWFSINDLPQPLFLPLQHLVSGKSIGNNIGYLTQA